jgi:predicted nucleic acid-binding protein
MYHAILRRIEMFKEDWVAADHWEAALNYCRDVDADDAPHVAITLALNGLLWTGDTKLKKGLRAKGFERFFEPE